MRLRNRNRTPTCPGCGTKFSHDNTTQKCRACGLPDEVADAGADAIRKFQGQLLRDQGQSRAEIKRKLDPYKADRRKPKHGRSTRTPVARTSRKRILI